MMSISETEKQRIRNFMSLRDSKKNAIKDALISIIEKANDDFIFNVNRDFHGCGYFNTYIEKHKHNNINLPVIETLCVNKDIHNLLPIAGRDWATEQLLENTGAGTRGANYIALSETTSSIDDSMTTLTGELTLYGLGRALATITHVDGTNSTLVDKTFSCSGGSYTTGISTVALFNNSSGGTMFRIAKLSNILPVANGESYRALGTVFIG